MGLLGRGGCICSWWGNRRERDNWGDLGANGWIILGWIFGDRAVYRLRRSRRRWVDNIRMDLWGEFSVYVFGGETGGKLDRWGELGIEVWIILG
jgi:hypothetical protein